MCADSLSGKSRLRCGPEGGRSQFPRPVSSARGGRLEHLLRPGEAPGQKRHLTVFRPGITACPRGNTEVTSPKDTGLGALEPSAILVFCAQANIQGKPVACRRLPAWAAHTRSFGKRMSGSGPRRRGPRTRGSHNAPLHSGPFLPRPLSWACRQRTSRWISLGPWCLWDQISSS